MARLIGRQRWDAEKARAVLRRLDASGMSVGEFAGRYGVDAQRLYRWRTQLAKAAPAPAFIEIERPVAAAIEVVLRSAYVIRVRDGFGEEALRRVVAVLEGGAGARC